MTDTGYTSWTTDRSIAEELARFASDEADLSGRIVIFRARISTIARNRIFEGLSGECEYLIDGTVENVEFPRTVPMKKTTERTRKPSWLGAITEAAKLQQLQFPSFDQYGMGALRSASTASGRFVTLKRRFVLATQAEIDGVEWGLWREQDDLPLPVAGFREPLRPTPEIRALVLPILKGWLVEEWTTDAAKAAVAQHPRAQVISEARPPCGEKKVYWLSDDRAFEIVVANDGWALSSRGKSLTSWRGRNNGAAGEHLPLVEPNRGQRRRLGGEGQWCCGRAPSPGQFGSSLFLAS